MKKSVICLFSYMVIAAALVLNEGFKMLSKPVIIGGGVYQCILLWKLELFKS